MLSDQTSANFDIDKFDREELLRQIEDQLMIDKPFEQNFFQSSRGDSYEMEGSKTYETERTKGSPHSSQEIIVPSSSEPFNLKELTREAEWRELAALDESPEKSTPLAYPLHPEERKSSSLTSDMLHLLDEVREFRGHVNEMQSRINARRGTPPLFKSASSATSSQPRASMDSTKSNYQQQRTSFIIDSASHGIHRSETSINAPSLLSDHSSLQYAQQMSANMAYGGQRASSVYISSARASNSESEGSTNGYTNSVKSDVLTQEGLTPSEDKASLPNMPDTYSPEDSSGNQDELTDGPETIEGLHIDKRRLSTSSKRLSFKPRGPRQFSGSGSELSWRRTSMASDNTTVQRLSPSRMSSTNVHETASSAYDTAASSIEDEFESDYQDSRAPNLSTSFINTKKTRPKSYSRRSTSHRVFSQPPAPMVHPQESSVPSRSHRRTNSENDLARHTSKSSTEKSKRQEHRSSRRVSSKPYKERVVSSPLYTVEDSNSKFRKTKEYHGSDKQCNKGSKDLNFDWQMPPGSEFDNIYNLELEHKRMLEKFIETLGRLSVDISFDDKKREEGRRRMDNALLALEGWI
ncbi:hypothetical protein V1511DRAFT_460564 [Dipodascopsis uninucleata]